MSDSLLLFLAPEGGFAGWLALADGAVTARGSALDDLPRADKGARIVAVVPGEQVTLHWLDLPGGLTAPQAAAAARLMAADATAEPLADMHVAVGREVEGEPRCVALVPSARMADWLATLNSEGLDPRLVLPDTLLLAPPLEGIARYDRGGIALWRGDAEAFALEADLADLLIAGRTVVEIGPDGFVAGLGAAVERPLLDLRQGSFARRREWKLESRRVRRMALLALALLLATFAIQAAAILRYTFAADSLETETRRVAAAALPRSAGVSDPRSELDRRLTHLRGGGLGFGATAAAAFGAIRATPNVELAALSFTPDGVLRLTVQGDGQASLAALAERIESLGFAVERAPPRSGGGRQVQDMIVRPR